LRDEAEPSSLGVMPSSDSVGVEAGGSGWGGREGAGRRPGFGAKVTGLIGNLVEGDSGPDVSDVERKGAEFRKTSNIEDDSLRGFGDAGLETMIGLSSAE